MSGLLRRIRRPGAAEETRTEATPASAPAHGSAPTPANGAHAAADGPPLPAGSTPEDLERRRTTGRRGKLRRRARFLRRARELALRDLGGLVYEARRREQDGSALVEDKVRRLAALDQELRALDTELGGPRGETVIREPGIGGTCRRCGELHASDARFCSRCGLELAAREESAPSEAPPEGSSPAEAAREERHGGPAAQAGNGRTTPADGAPAARAEHRTSEHADGAPAARAEHRTSEHADGAPAARAEHRTSEHPVDPSAVRGEPAAVRAETPDRPA
jgi:hypothetical protein